jgi:ABC-2 type transport system permease protein
MPWWIKPLAAVNPVRWYVELVRTVLLRGGGYRDVATQLGALSALSFGVLTVATLRFRRTIG